MNTTNTILSSLLAVFAVIIAILFAIILHNNEVTKDKEAEVTKESRLYPLFMDDTFGNIYIKEEAHYVPSSIKVPMDTTYDAKAKLMEVTFLGEKDNIVTVYHYVYSYIKGRQGELLATRFVTYNSELSQDLLDTAKARYEYLGILNNIGKSTLVYIDAPKIHFISSLGNDSRTIVNNFRKQQNQIP